MGMAMARALYWSNKPNPAIRHGRLPLHMRIYGTYTYDITDNGNIYIYIYIYIWGCVWLHMAISIIFFILQ
jgi:hypothetical protein